MITPRVFQYSILLTVALCLPFHPSLAEDRPKGIIFYVDNGSDPDRFAMPLIYSKFEPFATTATIKDQEGKSTRLLKNQLKAVIPVPYLGDDFTTEEQFNELRESYSSLVDARSRFERGDAILRSLIPKIEGMLAKADSGQVYVGGNWTYPEQMAITTNGDSEANAAGRTIRTKEGKAFERATIQRVFPDSLLVVHAGGISRINFEDLPEEVQKEFDYDPTAAAAFAAEEAKLTAARNAARRAELAAFQAEEQRRIQAEAEAKAPTTVSTGAGMRPTTPDTETLNPNARKFGGHKFSLEQILAQKFDLNGRTLQVTISTPRGFEGIEQIGTNQWEVWGLAGSDFIRIEMDRNGFEAYKDGERTFWARVQADSKYTLRLVGLKVVRQGLSGPEMIGW